MIVRLLTRVGKLKAEVATMAAGWGGTSVTGPAKVRLRGKVSEIRALVGLKVLLPFMLRM